MSPERARAGSAVRDRGTILATRRVRRVVVKLGSGTVADLASGLRIIIIRGMKFQRLSQFLIPNNRDAATLTRNYQDVVLDSSLFTLIRGFMEFLLRK